MSQALFGEVKGIHILHGPGESYAHLNQLTSHGVLAVEDDLYRLREDAPDVDVATLV